MATLYHHPFCAQSRFLRLVLGELGLEAELIEERVWERSLDLLRMNPAASTPVYQEEQVGLVIGAAA